MVDWTRYTVGLAELLAICLGRGNIAFPPPLKGVVGEEAE